jgi:hypothetical protein
MNSSIKYPLLVVTSSSLDSIRKLLLSSKLKSNKYVSGLGVELLLQLKETTMDISIKKEQFLIKKF